MTEPSDEVDDVVAAWRTERPDLDVAPLEVFSRLSIVARLLDGRRQRVFAEHGLAGHEFDVLAALRRAGSRCELTPGRLVDLTHVTSGTMTNRLERLAARKLVARRADPADGRQVLVRLTALGRRRVDSALSALLAVEHSLLTGLPENRRVESVMLLRGLLADLRVG